MAQSKPVSKYREMDPLSAEEEVELIAAWQDDGDLAARNRLVEKHRWVCQAIASRYSKNEEHVKDLAQYGVYALIAAADKFDRTKGVRFATYATWVVKSTLRQKLNLVTLTVDLPSRTLLAARGKEEKADNVSWQARQASRAGLSINSPMSSDTPFTLADVLVSDERNPEETVVKEIHKKHVVSEVMTALVHKIGEREADIIRRRYINEPSQTLREVGDHFGISSERVRQIEAKGLQKLRQLLKRRGVSASDIMYVGDYE